MLAEWEKTKASIIILLSLALGFLVSGLGKWLAFPGWTGIVVGAGLFAILFIRHLLSTNGWWIVEDGPNGLEKVRFMGKGFEDIREEYLIKSRKQHYVFFRWGIPDL